MDGSTSEFRLPPGGGPSELGGGAMDMSAFTLLDAGGSGGSSGGDFDLFAALPPDAYDSASVPKRAPSPPPSPAAASSPSPPLPSYPTSPPPSSPAGQGQGKRMDIPDLSAYASGVNPGQPPSSGGSNSAGSGLPDFIPTDGSGSGSTSGGSPAADIPYVDPNPRGGYSSPATGGSYPLPDWAAASSQGFPGFPGFPGYPGQQAPVQPQGGGWQMPPAGAIDPRTPQPSGQPLAQGGPFSGGVHTAAGVLLLLGACAGVGYYAYGAAGAAAAVALGAGAMNLYRAPAIQDKSPVAEEERSANLLAAGADFALGAWVIYHIYKDHHAHV